MDKKRLKHFTQVLTEMKRKIITDIVHDNIELKELSEDRVGDLVDRAFDSYERDKLYQIGSSERNQLQAIDDALERINNGTYGKCVSCDRDISAQRLKALPFTRLCINCKEKEEEAKLMGGEEQK